MRIRMRLLATLFYRRDVFLQLLLRTFVERNFFRKKKQLQLYYELVV